MRIRVFKEKDATELSELISTTVKVSNKKDYSEKAIKVLCDAFSFENLIKNSKKMDIFVACQESKFLGTITLDDNIVRAMFVLPTHQKKGIGRKLLKHAEKHAKKKGINLLRVRASLTAYEFYIKNDYQKTQRTSNKLIGPIVWLKKEL